MDTLQQSAYWPHITPAAFLKNIKNNVNSPIGIYAGKGTNFCGYGALTYLFLQEIIRPCSLLVAQLPSVVRVQEAFQLVLGLVAIYIHNQVHHITTYTHKKSCKTLGLQL